MFGDYDSSSDYRPLGYLGRLPIYVTTLIVIVESVFMVAVALLAAGGVSLYSEYLVFSSSDVLSHFQFWRLLTYPLYNGPSIWFAVEMYFLYSFGREVERFIGRTAFGMLYISLAVVGSCILTAVGTWMPSAIAGSRTVNLAVFVAFATIYPDVEIFFTLKAKWIAAILLGIDLLALLANRDVIGLLVFVPTCFAAFLFIKYLRGHIRFSFTDYFRLRRSKRNLRPLPRPQPKLEGPAQPPTYRDDVIDSIDPLLEKISKHGIGSLTEREREKLEQARAQLLKKPEQ